MATIEQFREVSVEWASDADKFFIRRLDGLESMGRIGQFDLELLSEDPAVDLDDVLGDTMAVRFNHPGGGKRYFHGYVTQVSLGEKRGRFYSYRVRLRPWLWFLTRTADCRIFQEKTVIEIIEAIFQDFGIADFDKRLSHSYSTLDYCVQYRESAFDFVSRLMEQWGIYYFFEHASDRHSMILCDSHSAHDPLDEHPTLRFHPGGTTSASHGDTIYLWSRRQQVLSGAYALREFDFEAANLSIGDGLEELASNKRSKAQGEHEIYDYPGLYSKAARANGKRFVRDWLHAEQAEFETVRAHTEARGVTPGGLFTLEDHTRADQNAEYLITAARYSFATDEYDPRIGVDAKADSVRADSPAKFQCRFDSVPGDCDFRSRRETVRPIVQGPQTAMVVGPAGEEIWTDKFGRVKVKFHWDRVGKKDETASCWVRVAQGWAGKSWGGMFIPRIGHEVVISFLEGNPDRPLITGCVYNSDAMPPYELPGNATRSTIMSNSSKGGDGYNELRFEDKKGSEEVYVQAERDFNRVVKNNDSLKVGFEVKSPGDQEVEIKHDQLIKVGNDHELRVESKSHYEAKKEIMIKVGQSSIKLEPGQITINTPVLKVSADTTIDMKSGGTAKIASSGMMDIKAGAVLTITGSLVKIN